MKYLNKAIKIVIYTVFLCIVLISFASLYVYFKKDKIVPFVVEKLNTRIKGEIEYDEIKLSSFSDLSTISILITKPSFLLKNDTNVDTLMKFEQLDLEFDIIKLLQSEIDIEALTFHDGEINFIQVADSSYSIMNALTSNTIKADTSQKDYKMSLDLSKINAQNVKLRIKPLQKNDVLITTIGNFQASIFYAQDSLSSLIDMNSTINELKVNQMDLFVKEDFSINTTFSYSIKHNTLYIAESTIELMEAIFTSDGSIIFDDDDKKINLQFSADDKDLKFTKLFLSEAADSLIEKGKLYLKGNIKGSLRDELPMIHVSFGAEDLTLNIPETNDQIKNLDFDGHFYSGSKRDLSEALLKIDTISALLPDGYLNGHFKMTSFKDPYLNYHLKCRAKLDGFDKLLNQNTIDSIGGSIKIDSRFMGYLHLTNSESKDSINDVKMELSNLSFRINKTFVFENIQSEILTKEGQLTFDSTRLNLNKTQLIAEGSISNYFGFFLTTKSPTVATVAISTPLFDFPSFFSYDTTIGASFPYQIKNAQVEVIMTTSKRELSEFTLLPSIAFEIKKLIGSAPKLCSAVNIKKGSFQLGQTALKATLNFQDFDLSIGDKPIQLDLFYSWAENKDDSLVIDANFHEFDVVENVNLPFLQSLKDSSHIFVDGPVSAELVWETDSASSIKSIEMELANFRYAKEDSIISSSNTQVSAKNINGISMGKYALSTMNGVFDFRFGEIHTSVYEDKNIHFAVVFDKGHLLLDAKYDTEPFKKNMSLNIDSRPFDSIPNYKIKHTIKGTSVNKLFPSKNKSIVFGDVDLNFDIEFEGSSTKDFLASLEGQMLLKGDSMLIQGYDIDRLISNFKRSQNFNLIDLGAVAVAGPVGLLYSKGSDYARIFVGNDKDSTIIDEFYSEWRVKNGFFVVEDFAFSTDENRIAFDGWINMNRDSLDLQIALIDSLGCSIITQSLSGNISDPKAGKVKFVKTAIAPITNLVNDILDLNCDVFYDGAVKPTPHKKKKLKG